MTDEFKSLNRVKYYRDHLDHKIRPDGREFENYRPIVVNLGSITTADGSAIAKVGNTTVVCGIKAEFCQPKAETPDEGFLIPNIELPPLCSPKFRPGPPTDQAQVLTQLLADILKNSKCLDLKSLGIYPDKLAWCLYADLICLDFDGSVIDACIIALIAALKSVTLPQVEYDPALDHKQVSLEDRRPLDIDGIPSATTFVTLDGTLLIDPTNEEEDLSTSQLVIVIKDDKLCMVHKPGGTGLSDDQLFDCIKESKKRGQVITALIKGALGNT